MNFFTEAYIKPYSTKFMMLSFSDLIKKYYQHETEIEKDLIGVVGFCLQQQGFNYNNDLFKKSEVTLSLDYEFSSLNRCFRVVIEEKGVKPDFVMKEIEIDEFGLIKSVLIEIPKSLSSSMDEISIQISKFLKNAYCNLESAFETNSETLTNKVFIQLHGIFNSELKILEREDLVGKCNFIVFNSDVGFHFFDRKTIRSAIQYFKTNQTNHYSPSLLIIWLMTQPVPFPKSLSFEALKQNKVLSIPWKKSKISKISHFFQASSLFHNFDDYTIYPIFSNKRGYSLSAISTQENQKEIEPIITKSKDSFIEVFQNGMKNYSIFIKSMNSIKTTINDSDSGIFIGKVIGAALDTIAKGQMS